ncbi:MAG: glycosyltransferase family 4 protein [Chloroflexota bacterium]|nr:glycosyltransferase family 4 protein [Chloroflexota bacterium]
MSLHALVAHLDRNLYQPGVVLSQQNHFGLFEQTGIQVARVRTPQWEISSGSMVEQVRSGGVGAAMREGGQRARLWHTLGGLRRLSRDILPVARDLRRAIDRFQPDLVHLNDAVPLVRHGIIASRLSGVPVIAHPRSFVPPTSDDDRWLVPRLQGLVFISQAVADTQLSAISNPPRHRVIPNGVDVALFQQEHNRNRLREELGSDGDSLLAGVVGRIVPWKGQDIFVEAVALLAERFPNLHGVIVGEGSQVEGAGYAARVRDLADKLGIGDRVHMLGFRPDIPQVMAGLDLLVHCSVEPEPFGRVIIEGMAAGKPVIASREGGATEIVSDGVDGLLVPPGDPQALADAMADLVGDSRRRKELASSGRLTARRFDVEHHVAAMQDFYETILSE